MSITLAEAVRSVLAKSTQPLSPAQIKDLIKEEYPQLYRTEAHRTGIEKGNYKNFDHALLNPIYALVTRGDDFVIDRSSRPMTVSLATKQLVEEAPDENYEAERGLVYVLSTGLYTESGKRILKIGYTTQTLSARIAQLYTTGTPFQFEELYTYQTKNYIELEQALHRLFSTFRISRAREFFTDDILEFVEEIVSIHFSIQGKNMESIKSQL